MLIIRGVNLFHTQVEAVLQAFETLSSNYQLVVKNEGRMDEVTVRVELDTDLYRSLEADTLEQEDIRSHSQLGSIHNALQHKIKNEVGLTMHLQLLAPGAIPRSEGGKLNRIVELREK
jgi:phenylacetate-CoA ligase